MLKAREKLTAMKPRQIARDSLGQFDSRTLAFDLWNILVQLPDSNTNRGTFHDEFLRASQESQSG